MLCIKLQFEVCLAVCQCLNVHESVTNTSYVRESNCAIVNACRVSEAVMSHSRKYFWW